MFNAIKKEPKKIQDLLYKVLKYHFDWDPNEKSQHTKVKQVETWIVAIAKDVGKTADK